MTTSMSVYVNSTVRIQNELIIIQLFHLNSHTKFLTVQISSTLYKQLPEFNVQSYVSLSALDRSINTKFNYTNKCTFRIERKVVIYKEVY